MDLYPGQLNSMDKRYILRIQQSIEVKLHDEFEPSFCEVINESDRHSVPENSETHFKLTIVSKSFEAKGLVARHQAVYRLLSDELAGPVHALALHTYTEDEWQQQGNAPDSPDCRGGGR